MLPDSHIYAQFQALAAAIESILTDAGTPKKIRKALLGFTSNLQKVLPAEARVEIRAAEAKATVSASVCLLRRGG